MSIMILSVSGIIFLRCKNTFGGYLILKKVEDDPERMVIHMDFSKKIDINNLNKFKKLTFKIIMEDIDDAKTNRG